jgi:hypothetical protein
MEIYTRLAIHVSVIKNRLARMIFHKLNDGWNAEPNAPCEQVEVTEDKVELLFNLNPWVYNFTEVQSARLIFGGTVRWRLGPTNDEGWFLGQCRYSNIAPEWGEFYEIVGSGATIDQPTDWNIISNADNNARHFLFYLRDSTFECLAHDWEFQAR